MEHMQVTCKQGWCVRVCVCVGGGGSGGGRESVGVGLIGGGGCKEVEADRGGLQGG